MCFKSVFFSLLNSTYFALFIVVQYALKARFLYHTYFLATRGVFIFLKDVFE